MPAPTTRPCANSLALPLLSLRCWQLPRPEPVLLMAFARRHGCRLPETCHRSAKAIAAARTALSLLLVLTAGLNRRCEVDLQLQAAALPLQPPLAFPPCQQRLALRQGRLPCPWVPDSGRHSRPGPSGLLIRSAAGSGGWRALSRCQLAPPPALVLLQQHLPALVAWPPHGHLRDARPTPAPGLHSHAAGGSAAARGGRQRLRCRLSGAGATPQTCVYDRKVHDIC